MIRVITDLVIPDFLTDGAQPIYECDSGLNFLKLNSKKEFEVEQNACPLVLKPLPMDDYDFSFARNSARTIPKNVKELFEKLVTELGKTAYFQSVANLDLAINYAQVHFKDRHNNDRINIVFHNMPIEKLIPFWEKSGYNYLDRNFIKLDSLSPNTLLIFPDPELVGILALQMDKNLFSLAAISNSCLNLQVGGE